MVRKQIKKDSIILENISEECIRALALEKHVKREKSDLYFRLLLSGIARHFFYSPDDIFEIGFLRLEKSPNKDELFKVTILKDVDVGVVNADTLWKYYRGELLQESKFKELIENFMTELISYSQAQEMNITQLTRKINKEKRRN